MPIHQTVEHEGAGDTTYLASVSETSLGWDSLGDGGYDILIGNKNDEFTWTDFPNIHKVTPSFLVIDSETRPFSTTWVEHTSQVWNSSYKYTFYQTSFDDDIDEYRSCDSAEDYYSCDSEQNEVDDSLQYLHQRHEDEPMKCFCLSETRHVSVDFEALSVDLNVTVTHKQNSNTIARKTIEVQSSIDNKYNNNVVCDSRALFDNYSANSKSHGNSLNPTIQVKDKSINEIDDRGTEEENSCTETSADLHVSSSYDDYTVRKLLDPFENAANVYNNYNLVQVLPSESDSSNDAFEEPHFVAYGSDSHCQVVEDNEFISVEEYFEDPYFLVCDLYDCSKAGKEKMNGEPWLSVYQKENHQDIIQTYVYGIIDRKLNDQVDKCFKMKDNQIAHKSLDNMQTREQDEDAYEKHFIKTTGQLPCGSDFDSIYENTIDCNSMVDSPFRKNDEYYESLLSASLERTTNTSYPSNQVDHSSNDSQLLSSSSTDTENTISEKAENEFLEPNSDKDFFVLLDNEVSIETDNQESCVSLLLESESLGKPTSKNDSTVSGNSSSKGFDMGQHKDDFGIFSSVTNIICSLKDLPDQGDDNFKTTEDDEGFECDIHSLETGFTVEAIENGPKIQSPYKDSDFNEYSRLNNSFINVKQPVSAFKEDRKKGQYQFDDHDEVAINSCVYSVIENARNQICSNNYPKEDSYKKSIKGQYRFDDTDEIAINNFVFSVIENARNQICSNQYPQEDSYGEFVNGQYRFDATDEIAINNFVFNVIENARNQIYRKSTRFHNDPMTNFKSREADVKSLNKRSNVQQQNLYELKKNKEMNSKCHNVMDKKATVNVDSGVHGKKATVKVDSGVHGKKATVKVDSGVHDKKATVKVDSGVHDKKATVKVDSGVHDKKATVKVGSGVHDKKATVKVDSGVHGKKATMKVGSGVHDKKATVKVDSGVHGKTATVKVGSGVHGKKATVMVDSGIHGKTATVKVGSGVHGKKATVMVDSGIHGKKASVKMDSGVHDKKATVKVDSGVHDKKATVKVDSGVHDKKATVKVDSGVHDKKATVKVDSGVHDKKATVKVDSGVHDKKATVKVDSGVHDNKATVKVDSGVHDKKATVKVDSGVHDKKATVKVDSGVHDKKATVKVDSGVHDKKATVKVDSGVHGHAMPDTVNKQSDEEDEKGISSFVNIAIENARSQVIIKSASQSDSTKKKLASLHESVQYEQHVTHFGELSPTCDGESGKSEDDTIAMFGERDKIGPLKNARDNKDAREITDPREITLKISSQVPNPLASDLIKDTQSDDIRKTKEEIEKITEMIDGLTIKDEKDMPKMEASAYIYTAREEGTGSQKYGQTKVACEYNPITTKGKQTRRVTFDMSSNLSVPDTRNDLQAMQEPNMSNTKNKVEYGDEGIRRETKDDERNFFSTESTMLSNVTDTIDKTVQAISYNITHRCTSSDMADTLATLREQDEELELIKHKHDRNTKTSFTREMYKTSELSHELSESEHKNLGQESNTEFFSVKHSCNDMDMMNYLSLHVNESTEILTTTKHATTTELVDYIVDEQSYAPVEKRDIDVKNQKKLHKPSKETDQSLTKMDKGAVSTYHRRVSYPNMRGKEYKSVKFNPETTTEVALSRDTTMDFKDRRNSYKNSNNRTFPQDQVNDNVKYFEVQIEEIDDIITEDTITVECKQKDCTSLEPVKGNKTKSQNVQSLETYHNAPKYRNKKEAFEKIKEDEKSFEEVEMKVKSMYDKFISRPLGTPVQKININSEAESKEDNTAANKLAVTTHINGKSENKQNDDLSIAFIPEVSGEKAKKSIKVYQDSTTKKTTFKTEVNSLSHSLVSPETIVCDNIKENKVSTRDRRQSSKKLPETGEAIVNALANSPMGNIGHERMSDVIKVQSSFDDLVKSALRDQHLSINDNVVDTSFENLVSNIDSSLQDKKRKPHHKINNAKYLRTHDPQTNTEIKRLEFRGECTTSDHNGTNGRNDYRKGPYQDMDDVNWFAVHVGEIPETLPGVKDEINTTDVAYSNGCQEDKHIDSESSRNKCCPLSKTDKFLSRGDKQDRIVRQTELKRDTTNFKNIRSFPKEEAENKTSKDSRSTKDGKSYLGKFYKKRHYTAKNSHKSIENTNTETRENRPIQKIGSHIKTVSKYQDKAKQKIGSPVQIKGRSDNENEDFEIDIENVATDFTYKHSFENLKGKVTALSRRFETEDQPKSHNSDDTKIRSFENLKVNSAAISKQFETGTYTTETQQKSPEPLNLDTGVKEKITHFNANEDEVKTFIPQPFPKGAKFKRVITTPRGCST